jgi:hypothetical protein
MRQNAAFILNTAIIFLFNAVVVALIIARVLAIDNDKAHLLYMFYYPALIVVNFLIGAVLRLLDRKLYRPFWIVCVWMVFAFVPILVVLVLI